MSSSIEILDKGNGLEFSIAVGTQKMTFWLSDSSRVMGFTFDMTDNKHREAVENMVEVLQHQLETTKENK